jgi:vacuolar-type H+-ATPase subunit E/Vma4
VITIENLKKMESKILSLAEEEAKEILTKAKEESLIIKNENKNKLDHFTKETKEKIDSEIQSLITKELASAYMQARKIYLDERELIINDIIKEALDKLRDDKKYETFLEKNLKEFSLSLGKKFKVLCNKKDLSLIKKLSTKLKINPDIEEYTISSGVILTSSEFKVNLSIEALLDEKIKDIRKNILEVLEK